MSSDTTKRKIGRPHAFTETKQEQLLRLISEGMSMARACKKVDIAYTTVHEKDEDDAEFAGRLARARRRGAWARADFANDTTRDMYERAKAGEASHEEIAAGRELLHQARWESSKLIPKIFGDRKQIEVGGELSVEHHITDTTELARRYWHWERRMKELAVVAEQPALAAPDAPLDANKAAASNSAVVNTTNSAPALEEEDDIGPDEVVV